MKKIGGWLAAFFAGVSAGLIVMYKLAGEKVSVNIKKIKNKRIGTSTTTIPIVISTEKLTREQRKEQRKQRKEARKQK